MILISKDLNMLLQLKILAQDSEADRQQWSNYVAENTQMLMEIIKKLV